MRASIENQADVLASVAKAESGEHVVVTRQGVAVARIVPMLEYSELPPTLLQGAERDAAIRKLKDLLTVGIPLGGRAPSKDEMHER